jgi:hypothetical protein
VNAVTATTNAHELDMEALHERMAQIDNQCMEKINVPAVRKIKDLSRELWAPSIASLPAKID